MASGRSVAHSISAVILRSALRMVAGRPPRRRMPAGRLPVSYLDDPAVCRAGRDLTHPSGGDRLRRLHATPGIATRLPLVALVVLLYSAERRSWDPLSAWLFGYTSEGSERVYDAPARWRSLDRVMYSL